MCLSQYFCMETLARAAMKRAILTNTSGIGHILPMLPVAKAAMDAGWEVLIAARPEVESTVAQHSVPFSGLDNTVPRMSRPRAW